MTPAAVQGRRRHQKAAQKGEGTGLRGRRNDPALTQPWLPVGADLRPSPRPELGTSPTGTPGRGILRCRQEEGWSHVPTAPAVPPAVPPAAVQYLRGSHLGMMGRGTFPAPPAPTAGREPSTTKQPGWASGTLLGKGTQRGWPLHLAACGVLLPPSQPKPSTSLLPPQLHYPCSLFLHPCQNPVLFLLPFFSSSGNPPAPPQARGPRRGREPGPGEPLGGVRTPQPETAL